MGILESILKVLQTTKQVLDILTGIEQKLEVIMAKVDDLKTAITEIGNDVTEIDTDLQSVLDKLAAAGQNGLTAEQAAEIQDMLTALKARTRATADKVPTP